MDVDISRIRSLARNVIAGTFDHEGSTFLQDSLSTDLLPYWYDDWVLVERERFRQLRLRALEAMCQQLTALGRFDQALEAGLAAVAGEPLVRAPTDR